MDELERITQATAALEAQRAVLGDVTGHGVPAALVIATMRSVLRAVALATPGPGGVLARVNNLLCPDMPPAMFVTCFCAVLDPASGGLRYANAGHPLPCRQAAPGLAELRATGLPLGLMPDEIYQKGEVVLAPGEGVLFYSDGVVEARSRAGELFGVPRLKQCMVSAPPGRLIDHVLRTLGTFAGPAWEPADDVTLLLLRREV